MSATPHASLTTISPSGDDAADPPLPMPAGCGIDLKLSVAQALGRTIDDRAMLRFVGIVQHTNTPDLVRIAGVDDDAAAVARIGAATGRRCTGAVASTAGARSFALASAMGSLGMSKPLQAALLANVVNATAAIAARASLDAADVDGVLAPFHTTIGELVGPPATASPGPCTLPDRPARVSHQVAPNFADVAANLGESGKIDVALRLDGDGFVRYVVPYVVESGISPASSLVKNALVAAAASTYVAARRRCASAPETFLYVSQFG